MQLLLFFERSFRRQGGNVRPGHQHKSTLVLLQSLQRLALESWRSYTRNLPILSSLEQQIFTNQIFSVAFESGIQLYFIFLPPALLPVHSVPARLFCYSDTLCTLLPARAGGWGGEGLPLMCPLSKMFFPGCPHGPDTFHSGLCPRVPFFFFF